MEGIQRMTIAPKGHVMGGAVDGQAEGLRCHDDLDILLVPEAKRIAKQR
jgi:hypothetical protein